MSNTTKILREEELHAVHMYQQMLEKTRIRHARWSKTEKGKTIKSLNQRIYLARKKGNLERVHQLEEEKRLYLEGWSDGK